MNSCRAAALDPTADSCDAPFGSLCQRALPNSYHAPTISPKRPVYSSISGPVSIDLLSPRVDVRSWRDVPSAIVPMPEAPINENGKLDRVPHEVWLSGQGLMSTPAG